MSYDVSKCDQVVFECMQKISEIIVQSRVLQQHPQTGREINSKVSYVIDDTKLALTLQHYLCLSATQLAVYQLPPEATSSETPICDGERTFETVAVVVCIYFVYFVACIDRALSVEPYKVPTLFCRAELIIQ